MSEVQTRSPRLEEEHRPRVTGAERDRLAESLAEEYKAGATIRSLAEDHGVSDTKVRQLLREAKVTVRPRSPRLEQGYRPRVRGTDRKRLARSLAEDYELGATIRSLAADRAMSYGTVRQLLIEAKVTLRGRGGRVASR